MIPALNEGRNLKLLLPLLKFNLGLLGSDYEIIIIDGGSKDDTLEAAREFGGKVIAQSRKGFGFALREGFKAAKGKYILTMDADLSHEPKYVHRMWSKRFDADLIIASRYVDGGSAQMHIFRYILSRILNNFYAFALSLKIKDLSSNFRMYRKEIIDCISTDSVNFDILPELLLKIYCNGWRIIEVPFSYKTRGSGRSHIKLIRFGLDYFKTLLKIWSLRNSINSVDYDFRAFYSKIFLQKFWQRSRYKTILSFVDRKSFFLDVGCGSSKIIIDSPNAIGLDLSLGKLRFLSGNHNKLVNADITNLPFKDASFDCVICSQVIEHIAGKTVIAELARVVNKGGLLVLGTPDYAKIMWRIFEYLYSIVHSKGYVEQHVTHYTYEELKKFLEQAGFEILRRAYILNAELIIKARKI